MPTPTEQNIARLERWIESIQREQDRLGRALGRRTTGDIERAFIVERLRVIEDELAHTRALLAGQQAIRFEAQMSFARRPRLMLKAVLRKPRLRKVG